MATSESVRPNLYVETLTPLRDKRHAISRSLFRSGVALIEISADFLVCAAVVFLSFLFPLHLANQVPCPTEQIAGISVIVGALVVLLLHKDGAYRGSGSLLCIRETERAIRLSAQSLLLLLPLSLLLQLRSSLVAFLLAVILVPTLLVVEKQIFVSALRLLNISGYGADRVVVYGAGEMGRRTVSALLSSPRLGLSPVAVIDDDPDLIGSCIAELGYRRRLHDIPVYGGPVTATLLQSLQCDLLIMSNRRFSPEDRAEATRAANQAGARAAFLTPHKLQDSINIDGYALKTSASSVTRWFYAVIKRAIDLSASSLFLAILAPLFILIALLVRLDSPGPVLFIQKRVGRNGRVFNIYKFRSMYLGTPQYDFSPIDTCDRRITRVGRILRRTSLDELPQLINVLRGDMSLVGPRPEMPFIVQRYNSRQRHRLEVIPGITGLWQLSADRAFQIHENIYYDLYYIRHRSFFLDISILIHTLFFAMHGV